MISNKKYENILLSLPSILLILILYNISSMAFAFVPINHNYNHNHVKIRKETKSTNNKLFMTSLFSNHGNNRNKDDNDERLINRREIIALGGYLTGMKSYNKLLANAATTVEESTTTTSNIKIPKINLGKSSLSVSRTIQGYWQLAGGHGKYLEKDAINNMKKHYDIGITTLDTADIYGPSEVIMGKFVKDVGAAEGVVPCTKFCCFRFLDEIDRNEVRTRILKYTNIYNKSCDRLQVKKLPLVQFFWSNYDVKKYIDVALYLTELKEEGLIQEIGATNFDLKRLQQLKNADIPLVSHQVQLSALDRRPIQSGMAQWCAENDVSLIGFGTVGSGILSNKYLGEKQPSSEQLTTSSLRMYSKTASRFGSWKLIQELLHTMDSIATNINNSGRASNINISNVAQRYVLDATPSIASVLIGVRNCNHIEDNVNTHSFTLTQSEIDAIDAVVKKRDGPKGDVWDIERGFV